MTVFCAPKAFDMEDPNDPQRRALLSWLKLKPRPKIVLMGNEPTMAEIAKEFPEGWITVEETLDYNMRGMPMFHSMMARARAADTNVSMMINGDIVLLEVGFKTTSTGSITPEAEGSVLISTDL